MGCGGARTRNEKQIRGTSGIRKDDRGLTLALVTGNDKGLEG